MKIRQGFVSNSSSSSFFMAATKEAFDAAIETENDLLKLFVKKCFTTQHVTTEKLGTLTLVTFAGVTGENDSFEDFEVDALVEQINEQDREAYDDVDVGDLVNELQSVFTKLKKENNAISCDMYC